MKAKAVPDLLAIERGGGGELPVVEKKDRKSRGEICPLPVDAGTG
jgi:hypothetical protein